MNKKIFVLGSLNMDLTINTARFPEKGETVTGSDFLINPGGKGANQAVACGKLGAEVYMLGTVGDDLFGEKLITSLSSYNVNVDGVLTSDKNPTGTAIIIIENSDNRIIINAGANADQNIDFISNYLLEKASPGDILITQLEIPVDVLIHAYQVAKHIGMYVILNPAPVVDLPQKIFQYVDLLIPNEIEVMKITKIKPTTKNFNKIRQYFANLQVNHVLVTLGENGSCYLSPDGIKFYNAYKTTVVDTTAAGDTFIGALAVKLANGVAIDEAIDFASRAAAITVSRYGAQQAIPTINDLHC